MPCCSPTVLLYSSLSLCYCPIFSFRSRSHHCNPQSQRELAWKSEMTFAIFRSPPVALLWKHEGDKRKKKQGVLRISPLRERLSKAVSSFFWFRNLEDPRASLRSPPSFPKIPPYPQGLSSMDLLMSDIEALKAYALYLQNVSQVWSIPLPECYDQEKVAYYFSCRPHVIAFRILEVISSFAFAGIKLQTSRSFKFKKQGLNKDDASDSLECYIGQLLKESMLNLGPTFVKVGQSLSTRPDIFGSEISKALSELHDRVPAFPRATAMKIIEEELGCPVEKIFSYISMEPVAAASFGQVYRCCTLDGCVVAVKVQRPDLLHAVVRDIYILRLGLELLRKIAKRKNDLSHYADELGKGLVGELDYNLEAANASQFLEAHSNYPFMLVPKVFRHLTRKRVLTMDWVTGENPNSLLLQSRGSRLDNIACSQRQQLDAKARLLDLVNKGVEATLVQLLETGLLHADPHPGNLCYTPDGRIGFLDFGLLCRMERRHQLAMLASIMHIINGDWGALVYDLTLMDVVKPGTNLRQVTMDLEDALGEVVFKDGIPDIKFSRVLGKIWSVALKYHFRMPSYYTLVLRSLASLEGLALAADQDFKTFQAAYPYVVQKLFHDNSIPSRKILYSVVFNKKREFQWHKIFLFLKISSMRKNKVGPNMFNTENSHAHHQNGGDVEVIEATQLILRLLASKDGSVLRRLLMAADGASLSRAMVSKDATIFRRHLSRALADVIYKWMVEAAVIRSKSGLLYDHQPVVEAAQEEEKEKERGEVMKSIVRDRRVRAIVYKVVSDTRRSGDPILMARTCWSSCAVFTTASVIAFRRFLFHLLAALYTRFVLSFEGRFAVGV